MKGSASDRIWAWMRGLRRCFGELSLGASFMVSLLGVCGVAQGMGASASICKSENFPLSAERHIAAETPCPSANLISPFHAVLGQIAGENAKPNKVLEAGVDKGRGQFHESTQENRAPAHEIARHRADFAENGERPACHPAGRKVSGRPFDDERTAPHPVAGPRAGIPPDKQEAA